MLSSRDRANLLQDSSLRPSCNVFLDTNILVYGDDGKEPAKQRMPSNLIKDHRQQRTGVVSLQVLQEYFVTATKKHKLDAEIATEIKSSIYSKFHVGEPTVNDILAAIDLHRLHGISLLGCPGLRMAKQTAVASCSPKICRHGQVFDGEDRHR